MSLIKPYFVSFLSQLELAHKLIDIIEDRGGKFHNATLGVLEERYVLSAASCLSVRFAPTAMFLIN